MLYRQAEPADEKGILAVFRDVFGIARGAGRWEWQYRSTPAGSGFVGVAEDDGRIVGCLTLMRQDLNVTGTRVPAAQACDGMMEPAYRKGGHFSALGHSNDDAARAAGLEAIVGFPNQQSFPTMIRHLGHDRVLVLKHYYRRLGARRVLGAADGPFRPLMRSRDYMALRILRMRRGERLQMDASAEVPAGADALLAALRRLQVVSVWKDEDYLRWRYQEHPENEYEFVSLRRGDEMLALAVTRRMPGAIAVCELMQKAHDPRIAAVLLHRLALRYGAQTENQLIEFYGSDISFFDAAFAEAGWRASAHSPLTMTAKALRDERLRRLLPIAGNWTVSWGDTDVI